MEGQRHARVEHSHYPHTPYIILNAFSARGKGNASSQMPHYHNERPNEDVSTSKRSRPCRCCRGRGIWLTSGPRSRREGRKDGALLR